MLSQTVCLSVLPLNQPTLGLGQALDDGYGAVGQGEGEEEGTVQNSHLSKMEGRLASLRGKYDAVLLVNCPRPHMHIRSRANTGVRTWTDKKTRGLMCWMAQSHRKLEEDHKEMQGYCYALQKEVAFWSR